MSRYIDAEKLIRSLAHYKQGKWGEYETLSVFELESAIENFADTNEADVVEVVRCGECIHWNAETKGCKRNPSVYRWYAKDFCSNGVR